MSGREFRGTGERQHASPHRIEGSMAELGRLETYHTKAQTHLWVLMLTHRATDVLLDQMDAQEQDASVTPILDVDTMLGQPGLICYICEASYEPRLRRRKCPGEPALSIKRGER